MFSTEAFLCDNFDSPQSLIALLSAYGAPMPKEATIKKWFQRASIPGEWLPIILAYLELDSGRPVSLVKYIGGCP